MTDAAISVSHVTKHFRVPLDHGMTLQHRFSHPISSMRYRNLLAINDLSCDVGRGEFLGITGPNGCGKSTLLKMLARIYAPDSGQIVVNGEVSPFLELGVGFKPELTARENIVLGGVVLGLTRRELARRADKVLEFAELQEFGDQKLKNFSSGMAVRLAFSVAIEVEADILLMDEVLAVGDARFQEKCFDVFANYKRNNRTVVLVSHDLSAIELYCDRALLLQDGRLAANGNPAEVTSYYRGVVGDMSGHHVPATTDLSFLPSSRRWGSRQVEITGISVCGPTGEPHHSVRTGASVAIALDYIVNEPVRDIVCGLGLRRSEGTVVGGAAISMSQIGVSDYRATDRGRVIYDISDLNLLGGSYLLTAALTDPHDRLTFDRVEDALEFRVVDDKGRFGVVELGGEWRHVRNGRQLEAPAHS